MTQHHHTRALVLPLLAASLLGACEEAQTTAPDADSPPDRIISLAKPPSCPAETPLTINAAATPMTGAIQGDGSSYAAHLSGANGNLAFFVNLMVPARTVSITTDQGTVSVAARIYTNTHELACGLAAMTSGSTGTGVLEAEWSDATNRYVLRYGKNCVGDFGTVVPANKIATSRVGDVWTLSGDDGEGILCRGRLSGKPAWSQAGTGGAFTMTMTSP